MNTDKNQKKILETEQVTQPATPAKYEAPRIARKQSLERVTLASGNFAPGGGISGF